MPPLYELEFPKSDRGIVAVAFCPRGEKLATVAMDNSHTMYIWDISTRAKKQQRQLEDRGDALATIKTMQGAPPTVRPQSGRLCRASPMPGLDVLHRDQLGESGLRLLRFPTGRHLVLYGANSTKTRS
jgi:WD40 repeat protein